MPPQNKYRPSFSYKIWSDSEPVFGAESFHCPMRRGFKRARNKEPIIESLCGQDNTAQTIGQLAQRGIYEFHADSELLDRADGAKVVADLLDLRQLEPEITEVVIKILNKYHVRPILKGKKLLKLEKGDEGWPDPIVLKLRGKEYNFYAAMDCVYVEADGTIHILDFKTGKSKFDLRQAYTYLLAAKYLYPEQPVVASFYNLDSEERSKNITASPAQIQKLEMIVVKFAQSLEDDLKRFHNNPAAFNLVFPPNPGIHCQHCSFNSICDYTQHNKI
jgi:PD-(D/E)XK nuclease superfamily